MENLLLTQPQYKIEETAFGAWKRFLYPSGQSYAEFTAHRRMFGLPLIHYTSGVCPETGRRRIAKGVLAVGRVAVGVCALGQASAGIIALGQAAFGVLLGVGQLATGLGALGQLCVGGVAIGQMAVGVVAVGQVGVGFYVLAQEGHGSYLWSPRHTDPAAKAFFRRLFFH